MSVKCCYCERSTRITAEGLYHRHRYKNFGEMVVCPMSGEPHRELPDPRKTADEPKPSRG